MRARKLWWIGLPVLTLALAALLWLGDTSEEGDRAAAPRSAPVDALAQVARGEYLSRIGNCSHCHTARGGEAFAGGRAIETPFGPVYSSNLTPDRERGLGAWSADDFWRALHYGIGKDQRLLNPAFPYTSYTRVTRTDADALFAYLQSLPAATTLNKAPAMAWPYDSQWALRIWRKLFFKPLAGNEQQNEQQNAAHGDEHGDAPPATPSHSAEWQRGAYLVQGLGHCMECHASRNALGALQSARNGRGGVLPVSQWYAPSLGRASEASMAQWSQESIVRFLTTGVGPVGFATGPMAEVVLHGTQYLEPRDAAAMALYLQTPEQSSGANVISSARLPPADAGQDASGRPLYEKYCSNCHGAQGQGQAGAYPALVGNRNVAMANTNNLIQIVLHGGFPPATRGNPRPFGMPPFMLQLNDQEMAQVLSYIRAAWGNQASAVSANDISQLRRAQSQSR